MKICICSHQEKYTVEIFIYIERYSAIIDAAIWFSVDAKRWVTALTAVGFPKKAPAWLLRVPRERHRRSVLCWPLGHTIHAKNKLENGNKAGAERCIVMGSTYLRAVVNRASPIVIFLMPTIRWLFSCVNCTRAKHSHFEGSYHLVSFAMENHHLKKTPCSMKTVTLW